MAARNKVRERWECLTQRRREKEIINNTSETPHRALQTHVIGVNDEEIRECIRNGTIASAVECSRATSSIGTENDPSKRMTLNMLYSMPKALCDDVAKAAWELRG